MTDTRNQDDVAKRTTVTFEDDLYAKVEALAADEQRTVPNLLVWLAAKAVKAKEDSKESGNI